MRHVLMLIGSVALVGLSAAGQGVPNSSLLVAMPFVGPFAGAGESNKAIAPAATLPVSFSGFHGAGSGSAAGEGCIPTLCLASLCGVHVFSVL
jgi:hypothetical protein